jgi:hypothetical protein
MRKFGTKLSSAAAPSGIVNSATTGSNGKIMSVPR